MAGTGTKRGSSEATPVSKKQKTIPDTVNPIQARIGPLPKGLTHHYDISWRIVYLYLRHSPNYYRSSKISELHARAWAIYHCLNWVTWETPTIPLSINKPQSLQSFFEDYIRFEATSEVWRYVFGSEKALYLRHRQYIEDVCSPFFYTQIGWIGGVENKKDASLFVPTKDKYAQGDKEHSNFKWEVQINTTSGGGIGVKQNDSTLIYISKNGIYEETLSGPQQSGSLLAQINFNPQISLSDVTVLVETNQVKFLYDKNQTATFPCRTPARPYVRVLTGDVRITTLSFHVVGENKSYLDRASERTNGSDVLNQLSPENTSLSSVCNDQAMTTVVYKNGDKYFSCKNNSRTLTHSIRLSYRYLEKGATAAFADLTAPT